MASDQYGITSENSASVFGVFSRTETVRRPCSVALSSDLIRPSILVLVMNPIGRSSHEVVTVARALNTTARGYGASHRKQRAAWQARIDAGELVRCACRRDDCPDHHGQCPTLIRSGDRWDLGHAADRRFYTGPECVGCNRSAGARHAAAVTNGRPRMVRRGW